jgi:hypothetical protein
MNFVVENSKKIFLNGFNYKGNELNVFTFKANNICYVIYP